MSEENPLNESKSELVAAEELLGRAIGGWRGVIDSGLPTVVFLVSWTVTCSAFALDPPGSQTLMTTKYK